MSKFVFCTLPYAALVINGIDFEPCPGGVVSVDPVDGEDAERFGAIDGYTLVDEKPGAAKPNKVKAEGAAKSPANTTDTDKPRRGRANKPDEAAAAATPPEGEKPEGEGAEGEKPEGEGAPAGEGEGQQQGENTDA